MTKEELLNMRKQLLELKKLRFDNYDLMGRLEKRISVQNYKICCSQEKLFEKKISDLEKKIYLEEIKSCDHIMARVDTIYVKFGIKEPVYYCLRCDLTNIYNIMGPETIMQKDIAIIFKNTKLSNNQIIDLENSDMTIMDGKKLLEKAVEETHDIDSDVVVHKMKQLKK